MKSVTRLGSRISAECKKLVKLFANMPTDEFLVYLIKSKAAEASTMMPSVGLESGLKVVSKNLTLHSGVVSIGASNTSVMKDQEKKRHRDGHFSKGHHSKKLKEPVSCPSSGGVGSLSENDMGSFPQMRANVEASGVAVKRILLISCPWSWRGC